MPLLYVNQSELYIFQSLNLSNQNITYLENFL